MKKLAWGVLVAGRVLPLAMKPAPMFCVVPVTSKVRVPQFDRRAALREERGHIVRRVIDAGQQQAEA